MQTAKKILAQPKGDRALLNYRDTPHSTTGVSPAEALLGRRLRTLIPVLPQNLAPQIPNHLLIKERDSRVKEIYKQAYDQRHGARPLPVLHPGQEVPIRTDQQHNWKNPGVVLLADPANRSYHVATPQGVLRRNRQHLKPVPTPAMSAQPQDVPTPVPNMVPSSQVHELPPAPHPVAPATPVPQVASPIVPPVVSPATVPQPSAPSMPLRRSGRTIVKPARFRETN